MQQGLTAILNNATMLAKIEAGETAVAAATTTLHLQTSLGQIGLQLNKYDGAEAAGNATALRGTSDNFWTSSMSFRATPTLSCRGRDRGPGIWRVV